MVIYMCVCKNPETQKIQNIFFKSLNDITDEIHQKVYVVLKKKIQGVLQLRWGSVPRGDVNGNFQCRKYVEELNSLSEKLLLLHGVSHSESR